MTTRKQNLIKCISSIMSPLNIFKIRSMLITTRIKKTIIIVIWCIDLKNQQELYFLSLINSFFAPTCKITYVDVLYNYVGSVLTVLHVNILLIILHGDIQNIITCILRFHILSFSKQRDTSLQQTV